MNQKAKIFTCDESNIFKPINDKTIMIRLLNNNLDSIKHKDDFYKIIEVNFNDVQILEKLPNAMTKKLLEQIDLSCDGELNKYDLVICSQSGVSCSSAVSMALNNIYDLGYENIKDQYQNYDRQIYSQILQIKDKAILKQNTDYRTWCSYHDYDDYVMSGQSEKVLIQR